MDNMTNIPFVIASQYELVRRIISSLPNADLSSCEKVSPLWENAVRAERSSLHRQTPQMIGWIGSSEKNSVRFFLKKTITLYRYKISFTKVKFFNKLISP